MGAGQMGTVERDLDVRHRRGFETHVRENRLIVDD
jgi:hypothetical protein